MSQRIATFDEFWVYYLGEHRHPWTRRLHCVGTGFGLTCHLILVPVTRDLWWIPLAYLVGYFFAWASHFRIERNRPATFKYPYWSFFSDLEMFQLMLVGWLPAELEALFANPVRRSTVPRQLWRVLVQACVFGYMGLVAVLWHLGVVGFGGVIHH